MRRGGLPRQPRALPSEPSVNDLQAASGLPREPPRESRKLPGEPRGLPKSRSNLWQQTLYIKKQLCTPDRPPPAAVWFFVFEHLHDLEQISVVTSKVSPSGTLSF